MTATKASITEILRGGKTYREIPGYEGYFVSRDGDVRSQHGRWCRTENRWRKLKIQISRMGYPEVELAAGHRRIARRLVRVHTLILISFEGPRPEGMEALHGDDDPMNCCLDNLRWGTRAENDADKVKHGRTIRGNRHPLRKLSEDDIPEVRRLLASGMLQREIAVIYGVTRKCINDVNCGRRWGWLE